jgi:hypothetical protein
MSFMDIAEDIEKKIKEVEIETEGMFSSETETETEVSRPKARGRAFKTIDEAIAFLLSVPDSLSPNFLASLIEEFEKREIEATMRSVPLGEGREREGRSRESEARQRRREAAREREAQAIAEGLLPLRSSPTRERKVVRTIGGIRIPREIEEQA